MWPFRRQPPPAATQIDWSEITGVPNDMRRRYRLVVMGPLREGGKPNVLVTINDVADAQLDPSGQWIIYRHPTEQPNADRYWQRIPPAAEWITFRSELVPR